MKKRKIALILGMCFMAASLQFGCGGASKDSAVTESAAAEAPMEEMVYMADNATGMVTAGSSAEMKGEAMEDVAAAKLLKAYGKKQGKKYTTLKKNCLINSTRKYDDLGDWLYFRLMIQNMGTFIRAALGDKSGLVQLLDEMFYDYNG